MGALIEQLAAAGFFAVEIAIPFRSRRGRRARSARE